MELGGGDVLVVVGGDGLGGVYDDTWIWQSGNWAPAATCVAPPPVIAHHLAYDATREVVVLFGGTDAQQALQDDTWEFRR